MTHRRHLLAATLMIWLKSRGTLEQALGPLDVSVSWHEFTSGLPLLEALNVAAANARRSYQVQAVDADGLADLQRIADAFSNEAVLPRQVHVAGRYGGRRHEHGSAASIPGPGLAGKLMNEWDSLYWLIFFRAVLITVLALRDPWGRELWDDEDNELPEQEKPPRRA